MTRTWTLLLATVAACTPSERPPRTSTPAPSAPPAPPAVALDRVLVLEPHLVPSELALEWSPPRPWTKSGAAVLESDFGVWRIDPRTHAEELVYQHENPESILSFVGSGGDFAVYESASRLDPPASSHMIVVDVETGTPRELALDANESLQAVSGDGHRVLSLVATPSRDGDPLGDSKLPVTLRVRNLDTLARVHEWQASSGVRFTMPGLSRMAFSRDGAHVFLPGAVRDEVHSVARGAVVWSSKEFGDSRAQFGSGFAAVDGPDTFSIVDLATGRARRIDIDCGGAGLGEPSDVVDLEQKLLARRCARGVLLVDWSQAKPAITRVRGTMDPWIGPDGAVSMMHDQTLWLRTKRTEAVRPAKPGETALLRKVGSAEVRRGAGYLLHHETCSLGGRTVSCNAQLSPDGTAAYEPDQGALGFLDVAAPGAAGSFLHQLATPNTDEQPLDAQVKASGGSLVVNGLEMPVHAPAPHTEGGATLLRAPDPRSAYPDVELTVNGLDLYHEPGRMVAQTMWAAPSGSKKPTLRLLFGAGFALIWDSHNHVQIAGDRAKAAHSLRCVRSAGARLELRPFSTCQAQVEKTIL